MREKPRIFDNKKVSEHSTASLEPRLKLSVTCQGELQTDVFECERKERVEYEFPQTLATVRIKFNNTATDETREKHSV